MWCNRNALKRSNWRNCAKLFRRIIRTRFDMIRKRKKSKGISFDTTSTEIYRDNTCYLFSFPLVFVTIMLRDRDFNVRSFPIFWKILPLKLASSVRYGLLPFVSSSVFFLIAFILSFFPVSFFFFLALRYYASLASHLFSLASYAFSRVQEATQKPCVQCQLFLFS